MCYLYTIIKRQTNTKMETTTTNPIVNLTPAELELIRIKREEQALADQKKAVEIQAKREKEIEAKKAKMLQDQSDSMKFREALNNLYKQLPEGYQIILSEKIVKYCCKEYSSSKQEDEVFFQDSIGMFSTRIVHTESGYHITAHDYFTYPSATSWRRGSGKYEGIRFELHNGDYNAKNKNLKSAKTINEKIQEKWSSINSKKKAEQQKLEGTEWLIDNLTTQFPTATITKKQNEGRWTNSHRRDCILGSQYVEVLFSNNLCMKYSFTTKDDQLQAIRTSIVVDNMSTEDKDSIIAMFAK